MRTKAASNKLLSKGFTATNIGNGRISNDDIKWHDDKAGIYVMCDAISGQAKLASAIVSTLVSELRKNVRIFDTYKSDLSPATQNDVIKFLDQTVRGINSKICSDPEKGRGQTPLSTLEMIVICGDSAFSVHMGNSRTYYIHDSIVEKITKDETLYESLKENDPEKQIDQRYKNDLQNGTWTIES
jgi:serine/threonine protein phosphatase PrpC